MKTCKRIGAVTADKIGFIKSHIEGPRWARSDQAIKNVAWSLGLKCKVERDTSFLRETVRFEVEGNESNLIAFKNVLTSSLEEWNDR